MKQFRSSVDWENSNLIADLYALYLGTVFAPGKMPDPQDLDQKDNRSPAALKLRLKLMPYLVKSTLAADSFPSAVQVSIIYIIQIFTTLARILRKKCMYNRFPCLN